MDYGNVSFAPWDGRNIPVTFIGGYLGAGKTTLLNALLERTSLRTAVLVNDVGSINIDAALIKKRNGNAIELTDGCICCSLSEGFAAAFDTIRKQETPPDHVLVELSGVAEPDRLRPWAATPGFCLDGVVVVIDAENFLQQEKTEHIGYQILRQIDSSDLLLISKTDLVDASQSQQVLDRLEILAPTVKKLTVASPHAGAAILEIGGSSEKTEVVVPDGTLFDQHKVEQIPFEGQSLEDLEIAVAEFVRREEVIRVKGVFSIHSETYLVQIVGSRSSLAKVSQAGESSGRFTDTGFVVISV